MTDTNPLAPIEALADRILGGRNIGSNGRHLVSQTEADELLAALDEARQAVDALVAERDEYERRWEEDARPALAERDAAREALARVEALADRWVQVNSREQPTAERFGGYHQGAVSARGKCLDDLRAALAQPATGEEAGQ